MSLRSEHFQLRAKLSKPSFCQAMDLHPSVLAWISTLPPEERRDYMVQLQLAFSAEAANSAAPTPSVDSLPLTAVEPPTTPLEEDSLPEESREWAPPDAEELASYRHQPLEPQAEPEHSEPRSNSMPERTEEFISTAEISPRDEPSEPEQANAEETEPQPNLEETTPQDTPAQPEPSSPQVQTPPQSEPQQQQQGPDVPIQQNTAPVVKPAAKPPPARLPQVTPQQPSGPSPTAPSPAKATPDSPVAVKANPQTLYAKLPSLTNKTTHRTAWCSLHRSLQPYPHSTWITTNSLRSSSQMRTKQIHTQPPQRHQPRCQTHSQSHQSVHQDVMSGG